MYLYDELDIKKEGVKSGNYLKGIKMPNSTSSINIIPQNEKITMVTGIC